MLEKTLTANHKVRLNPQYVLVAGVDDDGVPQLVRVTPDGELSVNIGGFVLPTFDEIVLAYYPTPLKTNLQTATYKLATVVVATITLTYVQNGTVENDILTGVAFA